MNATRLLKSVLVTLIGLHALFYALQNIANLVAAKAALAYVIGGTDHVAYPDTLFFKSDLSALHWAALIAVLAGEFAVASLGLKGGWDLFQARNADTATFHAAKRYGVLAAGMALITWFGLFMTFGSAFFQMWQTEVGDGSLNGAFMFATISAITILYVCLTPDD